MRKASEVWEISVQGSKPTMAITRAWIVSLGLAFPGLAREMVVMPEPDPLPLLAVYLVATGFILLITRRLGKAYKNRSRSPGVVR
jgi:hypothetical protein